MRDCTTKAYDGCTCAERCRIKAEREESKAVFNTLMAKRNADTVQMMVGTVFLVLIVWASFTTFTVPKARDYAKQTQEQVNHVARR
jgi:hypothetical protein